MSESLVKYYVYGTISGCIGVAISHPFDTIKTCIQENKPLNLSAKSLYKGIIPPLIGVGLEKAFGIVNSLNTRAMEYDKKLGFTEAIRFPGVHCDGGDLVVFEMNKTDCRWIRERNK
jgi:hypothetical protein